MLWSNLCKQSIKGQDPVYRAHVCFLLLNHIEQKYMINIDVNGNIMEFFEYQEKLANIEEEKEKEKWTLSSRNNNDVKYLNDEWHSLPLKKIYI